MAMCSSAPRIFLAMLLMLSFAAPLERASAFQGFEQSGQGSVSPERTSGRTQRQPSVRAARILDEPIRLDGILDDPAWSQAEAAFGFSMAEPDRGARPTEETVFKVMYDDDALYFAVACYEDDPGKISSTLTRRDRIADSDLVSVYLDPYLDRTTGYNFRVNPDGVLEDYYVFNDGERDRDWDAVWEAETFRDANGWYVEMRIPFSSIRYRQSSSMTWGLQVYRWMHGRGEDDGWVTWDRESRGFVSRFGTLTGIDEIRPPRQLEVIPYLVQRSTDPSVSGAEQIENFENFGADLKFGMTADLTLNATLQPDFGQVEADPSILNLSPFETFFEEKRPFFIEGARFFQHPDFNLFYSRRIGTKSDPEEFDSVGDPRIRFASKLTGKTAGEISIAAMFAATDIAEQGKTHNLLRAGALEKRFFITRLGKEFSDGAHRINVMQTALVRPGRERRDAFTTGVDFDLNFHDRDYNVQGSFVGSIIQPSQGDDDAPSGKIYGTGGALDLRRLGGNVRGGLWGRWESDRLSLNDMGFLSAPDEITGGGWLQFRLNGDGKTSLFNTGSVNLNLWSSVLYAGNREFHSTTQELLWSYDRGHHQSAGGNINGWGQFRNYWSVWYGVWMDGRSTSRFETRGGPLMTDPLAVGLWVGGETDFRKRLSFNSQLELAWDVEGARNTDVELGLRWNQNTRVNHRLNVGFRNNHHDAQFISAGNYDTELQSPSNSSNFLTPAGGIGIGGTSYVFGELDTHTFDLTLRTDVLFNRKQSLELYLQPFLTLGKYGNPRELIRPDSYDLVEFTHPDYSSPQAFASASDFNHASVNLNFVYRWEYRPGSTLFLVWTHSRSSSQRRHESGEDFRDDLRADSLLENEPENVFLAKLTYWFSI